MSLRHTQTVSSKGSFFRACHELAGRWHPMTRHNNATTARPRKFYLTKDHAGKSLLFGTFACALAVRSESTSNDKR